MPVRFFKHSTIVAVVEVYFTFVDWPNFNLTAVSNCIFLVGGRCNARYSKCGTSYCVLCAGVSKLFLFCLWLQSHKKNLTLCYRCNSDRLWPWLSLLPQDSNAFCWWWRGHRGCQQQKQHDLHQSAKRSVGCLGCNLATELAHKEVTWLSWLWASQLPRKRSVDCVSSTTKLLLN